MVVQVCSVGNSEGPKSRVNPWLQTCAWVEREEPYAFWNGANAPLINKILVMIIYSTVADMFIYVSEKGFGAKIPLSARYEYTMEPWSMTNFLNLCLAMMISDAENLSWCSTCIYIDEWSTNMHPPTYFSQDYRPNKVRVRPFKRDSKWSTDMQSPGQV